MKKVRRNNDKAGIIFLFTLISVVFFMDIYIELSRISADHSYSKRTEILQLNSGNSEHFISFDTSENIFPDIRHYGLKLSLFFYLIAAFSFFYCCVLIGSENNNKTLLRYISFINTGQLSCTSPRSPPEFI